MRKLLVLLILFSFSGVLAQEPRRRPPITRKKQAPPKKPEETSREEKKKEPGPIHAIVGARVLPVAGPLIHRGTVLFQDGKILRLGAEVPLPDGAIVHDAEGKYVTPGLVAVEASGVGIGRSDGKLEYGLDPYQRELKIALASGITTAHVVESGGSFSIFRSSSSMPMGGRTGIIKATVGDLEGMMLKEPGAHYFSFQQSPLGIYQLRDRFKRAAEYLKQVAEAEKKKEKPPRLSPEIRRHVDILKNEIPTVVVTSSEEEIRAILAIRREHTFDLVLSGAPGGWNLAAELYEAGVSVLTRVRDTGRGFGLSRPAVPEDGIIAIRRPAAFAEAGIPVAILAPSRRVDLNGLAGRDLIALHLSAAFAVRGGMDEGAALRAITLEPARILHIDDRVGSLEKGKDADILIWSRHPLDYRSFVEFAFINGKVYYERSKSPLFRDIPLR